MKIARVLVGLAPLVALGLPARSQAAPPRRDPEWRVVTTQSSDGSFVFSVHNRTCEGFEPPMALARGSDAAAPAVPVVMEITALARCTYLATPPAPVVPGRHCAASPLSSVQPVGELCFEVTGVAVDWSRAGVALDTSIESWSDYGVCSTCEDLATGPCTRTRLSRYVGVQLTGLPAEAASTHAFAFATSTGVPPTEAKLPDAAAYLGFTSALADATHVLLPLPGEESCVTVFARRPDSGEATRTLGRACLPPEPRTSYPASYNLLLAACDADYARRWCADNQDDCSDGTLGYTSCASYAQLCLPATDQADRGARPDDAGLPARAPRDNGKLDANSGDDADPRASDVEAGAPPAPPARGDGCQLGKPADDVSPFLWPMALALLLAVRGPVLRRARGCFTKRHVRADA